MLKMLLPVILGVTGLVGGAAAGWMLKPAAPPVCLDADGNEQAPELCEEAAAAEEALEEPTVDAEASEFVVMERPFIVPVMNEQEVAALVVASLSIEVETGATELVTAREPRLRDSLLRVLFDHAYSGGFNGDFTADYVMRDLRRNLLAATRKVVGPAVHDVLVVDIMKRNE